MSRLNRFTFQDQNRQPFKDSKNRVIVTFLYGVDEIHKVNTEEVSEIALRFLLGMSNEEIVGKSVRLRLSRDLRSVYPNEIMVETADGDYVGFIRNEVWLTDLLDQVLEEVRGFVPNNSGFVFDFWAEVSGIYFDEQFVDEEGNEYFYKELESEIRFKYPIEIDILSSF